MGKLHFSIKPRSLLFSFFFLWFVLVLVASKWAVWLSGGMMSMARGSIDKDKPPRSAGPCLAVHVNFRSPIRWELNPFFKPPNDFPGTGHNKLSLDLSEDMRLVLYGVWSSAIVRVLAHVSLSRGPVPVLPQSPSTTCILHTQFGQRQRMAQNTAQMSIMWSACTKSNFMFHSIVFTLLHCLDIREN